MFLFIMHGISCGLSQLKISHICMVCYKLRAFILPITGQCFTHLFDHDSDRMYTWELSFDGIESGMYFNRFDLQSHNSLK